MESEARLDSAVFQLTPTRTRYGLVINADRRTEKIASGLLDPFLAHLKAARDQVARGGYSIILVPKPRGDGAWFTKGTMERFVRFVNTPEVLERVNKIESEGLQIEEAIAIQNNDSIGLSTIKDHQKKVRGYRMRSLGSTEGRKPSTDGDVSATLVIYENGAYQPDFNGSTRQEDNSKVQFLRVLETRKTLLQKEQDMAFARAVAAGFDMDHMTQLTSFAECFGASRLMEACLGFMVLWKVKHENSGWLENEATESISVRPDFSRVNAPNVLLCEIKSHNQLKEEQLEIVDNFGMDMETTNADREVTSCCQKGIKPPGEQEVYQNQFQHPILCQLPVHSLVDPSPLTQPYSVQSIPYHQNHLEGPPYSHPSYSQLEDPLLRTSHTTGTKRPSIDSKVNSEAGTSALGVSNRLQEPLDQDIECSQDREPWRKASLSGRKQSGVVVIRNINYVTSKRRYNTLDSVLSSVLPETKNVAEDGKDVGQEVMQSKTMRFSNGNGSNTRVPNTMRSSHDKDSTLHGQEEGGNWQAFENCLLRHNNDERHSVGEADFASQKETQIKRQQKNGGINSLFLRGRDPVIVEDRRMHDSFRVTRNKSNLLKASRKELTSQLGNRRELEDSHVDLQFTEVDSGRGHKKDTNDGFMISIQKNLTDCITSNSDSPAGQVLECATNNSVKYSRYLTDESFVVPIRMSSIDQAEHDSRTANHMSNALPLGISKIRDFSSKARRQLSYEPDDLKSIPVRGIEKKSVYDPAVNHEMPVLSGEATVLNKVAVNGGAGVKEGSKKLKSVYESPEKKKMRSAIKKGESSESNPYNEAQARAEKLGSVKDDPQIMKKKREAEEVKRLDALKRERQRRITARSSSGTAQSTLPSQMKTQQRIKISQVSYAGSKFSDSEPGKWSPLQRFPIKTPSLGPNTSQNITKLSRLNNNAQVAITRSSRSVSSLSVLKKENGLTTPETVIPEAHDEGLLEPKMKNKTHISSVKLKSIDPVKLEPKVVTNRVRRLSDPSINYKCQVSSINSRNFGQVAKPKSFDGSEVKRTPVFLSHEKSRAATLPMMKTRSVKGPSDMTLTKRLMEQSVQKTSKKYSVKVKANEIKTRTKDTSDDTNGQDKEVIEKTVVLENEMPRIPVLQVSDERRDAKNRSYAEYKDKEKNELPTEFAAPFFPASPLITAENAVASARCQTAWKPSSEVIVNGAIEELPKCSSTNLAAAQDHPPYARLSSLADKCSINVESHIKSMGNVKVHASKPYGLEKNQERDSSKGFKRLLNFRTKNHNSPVDVCNTKSNRLSTKTKDHAKKGAFSTEGHSLEFPISQGGLLSRGATQKASRPFSLLSSFRSKTAKKLTK